MSSCCEQTGSLLVGSRNCDGRQIRRWCRSRLSILLSQLRSLLILTDRVLGPVLSEETHDGTLQRHPHPPNALADRVED